MLYITLQLVGTTFVTGIKTELEQIKAVTDIFTVVDIMCT